MSKTWDVFTHFIATGEEKKIISFKLDFPVRTGNIINFAQGISSRIRRHSKVVIKDESGMDLFHIANETVYDSSYTVGKRLIVKCLEAGLKVKSEIQTFVFGNSAPNDEQLKGFEKALYELVSEDKYILMENKNNKVVYSYLENNDCGHIYSHCGCMN